MHSESVFPPLAADPTSSSALPTDRNLERFRLLVEKSRDIIAEVTLEGTITYGSPNVEAVLGYAPDELLHTSLFALVHPEDLTEVRQLFVASAGSATCRGRHKDNSWRWIETSCRDFTSPDGQVRKVMIARDITERKAAETDRQRLEIQLIQAQKRTLLGTLTGGIAHDFNNVLTAICANAQLAGLVVAPDAPAQMYLEQILVAAQRAEGMVRRLLAFGRGQAPERRPIPLGPIVLEVIELLRPILPTGVRLEANLQDDGVLAVADPTQVHQALMNLCINAAQAMPKGTGQIDISIVRFRMVEGFSPAHAGLGAGPYLRLTVSDTGMGMDAATVNRIFEPYFTSKPDVGTGLGLTVVQQVMKDHGGAVLVSSAPGQGSVFDLFFPRCEPGGR